ncbi:hypothetical protein MJD09_16030 [bacterium]|nr:hypothetical protein [bacterium]
MSDFKHRLYPILLLIFVFCIGIISGFAQTAEAKKENKTFPVTEEDEKETKEASGEDFVLDEILIEAVIEKPNVAILPTLELGDLGDILFIDRSFEEELKAVPRGLFFVDDKTERKKNIKRLKALLKQKRK